MMSDERYCNAVSAVLETLREHDVSHAEMLSVLMGAASTVELLGGNVITHPHGFSGEALIAYQRVRRILGDVVDLGDRRG